jgi:hypothetical protein
MSSRYAADWSPVTQGISSIANALDGNRKYGLQLQDQEMDRKRLAISQAAAGREAQLFPYKKQQIEMELAQAKKAAQQQAIQRGLGFWESNTDAYSKLPADQQTKHWNTFLGSGFFDDDDRKMFDSIPGWRDPVVGPKLLQAYGSKYLSQQDRRAADAKIGEDEASAELKRAQARAAGAKPSSIIKEGDKPLVIFEPDADGRLQARTVHEGPQGNAVSGIAGGMRELHDIPNRYGGDKGVFGSAVGAFQGDPNSYVLGPLSRAWGSLSSFTASGQGSTAPPAEVRRAIEGATNTLAASLKPLIRKPGEGSWSDRDQAVLDSIVGNLTRANDVAQYDRELENVRSRIEQNFGIKLPALARKPQADRLPAGQPAPTRSVAPNQQVQDGATATNPRTGQRIIFRNGQWQPL